ncbi:hypothetical protein PLICRDRAFT_52845 [Plicaturopsis crispa FD-325 SS-3]|nr:hypothetical protein PLICRDRAFT_52845 [Plicaturopsis crispa FD-325 SS-3]
MLGRKISNSQLLMEFDEKADVKVAGGSKTLGLRINTDEVTWNRPLSERTNNTTLTKSEWLTPGLPPASFTPNSTYTFGQPNPTTIISPPADPIRDSSRRRERYVREEEALATTLQHCAPEPSPTELKIRTLEKATAMLSAQATTAQQRAESLRSHLAADQREADPVTYVSLQRERWMEERRSASFDAEAKALHEHLACLTKSIKDGESPGTPLSPPPPTKESRKRANLAVFFARSPTKSPISPWRSSPINVDLSPRRMTRDDVTPMRLRPQSVRTPLKLHERCCSVVERLVSEASQRNSEQVSASSPSSSTSVLDAVDEDGASCPSLAPSAPPSMDEPSLSAPSQGSASLAEDAAEDHWEPLTNGGYATIYRAAARRTKAEILAASREYDVSLPEYALELLDDLDVIHDSIPLDDPRINEFRSLHPSIPIFTFDHTTNASSSLPNSPLPSPTSSHINICPASKSSRTLAAASTLPKRRSVLMKKRPLHRAMLPDLFAIPESPSTATPTPSPGTARARSHSELTRPFPQPNARQSTASLDAPPSVASQLRRRFSQLGRKNRPA